MRRTACCALSLAFGLALSGCGGGGDDAAAIVPFEAPHRAVAPTEVERGLTFTCAFDRFRFEDPIAHPGHVQGTHLHQFFGARGVHADSTPDELESGDTTCDDTADTAAYWAPALIGSNGTPVMPEQVTVTYRAGPDVDPAEIAPLPGGFMAVAGDELAERAQPTTLIGWSCSDDAERRAVPPDCDGARLQFTATFQDCWDGQFNRSPIVLEPALHLAYSAEGACPVDHPVHVPQVEMTVEYPPLGDELDGAELSSGDYATGHAYFWNTWRSSVVESRLMPCLLEGVGCTSIAGA